MSVEFRPRIEIDVILRPGSSPSEYGSIIKDGKGTILFRPPMCCTMTHEDIIAVLKAMDDFTKETPQSK